ncbi:cell cycle checkpoint control protein RAD9A-like [Bolinopsis microptera]|uniref:cell cycle checkpoint control protein RAD9A-like n=1 Tax=Bolinopsis microptera TaxID=2820187 RepID=UPI00307ABCB9
MNCTAPGRHIKVFGKAILCLAKVGEEIYFEGEASGLAVRTVNLSRSAYGSFLFQTSFFSKFSLQSQNSGELRCKVSARSCLSIFKNLASLEKSVDTFTIELKFVEGELVFSLNHRHGIKKQFNLTFQECEGLSAIFNKNSSVIHIVSDQKFLGDCVVHFPTNVAEITLNAKHDHTMLSNYVEEESQYGKVLQTEMRLASTEFSCYDVSVDREITFCLKEWRAILQFQDSVAQQLHLYFDDPGR